ncbi:MAG: hypothetical protein O2822_07075, partial [Chloroflexi bacterium]|nr:hypothetical protein [Chloroflexota bacterium]
MSLLGPHGPLLLNQEGLQGLGRWIHQVSTLPRVTGGSSLTSPESLPNGTKKRALYVVLNTTSATEGANMSGGNPEHTYWQRRIGRRGALRIGALGAAG